MAEGKNAKLIHFWVNSVSISIFFRSPLGFSELFNEFRLQENLHSLDDILNAIINSEGMSFNDLKPIYKEFLLKLAVTLTKDELYQRSKSIMRRQKKKLLRRKKKSTAYQVNDILLSCVTTKTQPHSVSIWKIQPTNELCLCVCLSFFLSTKIYRFSIHEKASFLVHMD